MMPSHLLTTHFLIAGSEDEPPAPLPLRAGPLTMLFEPSTVFLRCIRFGDREIVRCIYAAVRDRNWGTVTPHLENLRIDSDRHSFHLTFEVECRQGDIDFHWHGQITGSAAGMVTFRFMGEARTTFLRNRIGLCVLHPLAECAGRSCVVEHTDGRVEHGVFPRLVSPHPPFQDIRAISHGVLPGLRAELRLDGDVFEMEDQRNWTDGSFKTYCTPLALPFPTQIEKGTRIEQMVSLRLVGTVPRVAVAEEARITEVQIPDRPTRRRPALGLGLCGAETPHGVTTLERLRALRLSHLRAELHLARSGWQSELNRSLEVVNGISAGCRLECAVFLSDRGAQELEALSRALETLTDITDWRASHIANIARWLTCSERGAPPPDEWAGMARENLCRFAPGAVFAAGTNANFAELNRSRPGREADVLPCYSLNPQVHAFDNRSLVENLEGQADTVATTWEFTHREVVISPITLRPRFNAAATAAGGTASPDALPPQVDPRQLTLFGAVWTLGSLARLSIEEHLHSLTYFETVGWRGVMESEVGSRLPEKFPSLPGVVFPVYHVFAGLAGYELTAPTTVTGPGHATAMTVFTDGGRSRVLLGNLTAETQAARLRISARSLQMRLLDADSVMVAMREPERFRVMKGEPRVVKDGVLELSLPPHALATIEPV